MAIKYPDLRVQKLYRSFHRGGFPEVSHLRIRASQCRTGKLHYACWIKGGQLP